MVLLRRAKISFLSVSSELLLLFIILLTASHAIVCVMGNRSLHSRHWTSTGWWVEYIVFDGIRSRNGKFKFAKNQMDKIWKFVTRSIRIFVAVSSNMQCPVHGESANLNSNKLCKMWYLHIQRPGAKFLSMLFNHLHTIIYDFPRNQIESEINSAH